MTNWLLVEMVSSFTFYVIIYMTDVSLTACYLFSRHSIFVLLSFLFYSFFLLLLLSFGSHVYSLFNFIPFTNFLAIHLFYNFSVSSSVCILNLPQLALTIVPLHIQAFSFYCTSRHWAAWMARVLQIKGKILQQQED